MAPDFSLFGPMIVRKKTFALAGRIYDVHHLAIGPDGTGI